MTSDAKNSYHHGNLRETLLDHAIQIIRESGESGLSMRKLADRVGVSRSALYHHYKDKNHLLCDIAENGFIALDTHLKQVRLPTEEDPRSSIKVFVRGYIQFAINNPEQYNLMFGGAIWKSNAEPTSELNKVSAQSFKSYVKVQEKLQASGLIPANLSTVRLAQVSWATLHGLCRFMIDGIYIHEEVLDEMCDYAVKMLISVHKGDLKEPS